VRNFDVHDDDTVYDKHFRILQQLIFRLESSATCECHRSVIGQNAGLKLSEGGPS